MLTTRCVVLISSLSMMAFGADMVIGQDYPIKAIRMLAAEAGGGNDLVARLIAQGITAPLGQPVIVDNRGSNLVGGLGAKAPPDGYTLLIVGGTFTLAPLLENTSYDPVKDFVPITLATTSPNVLVVHPSLPVKSVKDLIALAKTRPGVLNYASGGAGSSPHLGAELLKSLASINIVRINYRGGGPGVTALVRGEVQLMIASAPAVASHLTSGRLKALAVTSIKPSRLLPDLPTVADAVPDYEVVQRIGVLAPANTSAAIVSRLNREMVRALNQPDVKEKLFSIGIEAAGNSPEEYGAMIRAEIAKLGKIIKDAGIKVE